MDYNTQVETGKKERRTGKPIKGSTPLELTSIPVVILVKYRMQMSLSQLANVPNMLIRSLSFPYSNNFPSLIGSVDPFLWLFDGECGNWWCYLFTDSELISLCKERFYVLTKSLGRWSLGGTSSAAVEPFVNWVSVLLLLIGLRNGTFSPPSPPVVHSGGASFSLSRGVHLSF